VLGPGSITVSSKSGALLEYSILWVVAVAAIFMITFTRIAAKIGCLNENSLLTITKDIYGRWLSVLTGISIFLICAGFQTGNNIGVGLAIDAMVGGGVSIWATLCCLISLAFISLSTNFYSVLEKVMIFLVALMILSFVGNLFQIKLDFLEISKGMLPTIPPIWGLVIAISATSFSLAGAVFQAYTVQSKGWKKKHLKRSLRDANIGIVILCSLSAIIIITSAAVLAPQGITVTSALDMGMQLEPLLGFFAKWLFLLGLLSASFSSFVANALLGGILLSDGLGLGNSINEKSVKIFTSVLLIGSTVIAILMESNPIELIVMAQASTVIGGPLIAILLILLANNKIVLGQYTNKSWSNFIAGLALLWIIYLSVNQILVFFI
jgi:Mn2+/Fe2+ NRAMP family transporter